MKRWQWMTCLMADLGQWKHNLTLCKCWKREWQWPRIGEQWNGGLWRNRWLRQRPTSISKMKTDLCIPTLSFLNKGNTLRALSFLEVLRASRLWLKRDTHQNTQSMGILSCECGLVSKLQLSQTPINKNKVFLGCPKPREARCGYFQWIHEPPKPNYVPKTATRKALKKRLADMVSDRMSLEKKQKTEGGFQFP